MLFRSLFRRAAAAAALLLTFTALAAAPPNVLFVLTEDQGAQLSYLGTPGLQTPNMDRLAEAGVYFDRAYVNYPVCSPSKANIYTGLYGHTSGLLQNTHIFYVPADELKPAQRHNPVYQRVQVKARYATLTELYRDAGYHTAVSGKLHVAPNDKFPYDTWLPKIAGRAGMERVIDAAKAEGKPWFFFCNIQAPHRPYRNSDKVDIDVDPKEVELPALLPDTPVTRKDWAEYLDYCQVADQRLGDVLHGLDASGELANTLIVLMGDHGPAYHRGKMSLYQLGLNVPLAVSGPGVPAGRRTSETVTGIDVFSTLLELTGIDVPENQGRSFAPLVRGVEGATGNAHTFAEIVHSGQRRDDGMQERSVFDGRFKLIYRENLDQPRDVNSDLKYFSFKLPSGGALPWRNRVYDEIVRKKNKYPDDFRRLTEIDPQTYGVKLPVFELYDTDADPDEFVNLADDAAYAVDLARLRTELADWAKRTDDKLVTVAKIAPESR